MSLFAGLLWFVLLLVRGIVLWLLVPFAVLAWLLVHWWAQRAAVEQALCWYDQALWAFLILVPFRLLLYVDPRTKTARFPKISEMTQLKPYKISPINDMV